ncbi:hypothetical protein AgCh_004583 [Apium graveolens]
MYVIVTSTDMRGRVKEIITLLSDMYDNIAGNDLLLPANKLCPNARSTKPLDQVDGPPLKIDLWNSLCTRVVQGNYQEEGELWPEGSSAGFTQQRAGEAMINMNHNNLMNVEAQPRFLSVQLRTMVEYLNHYLYMCVVFANVMVMRRIAVLAQQWRNGVKMMAAANKAMNYGMHLPQEWSY